MKTLTTLLVVTVGFIGSAFMCGKSKETIQTPPKVEKVSPLDDAYKAPIQIKETFEIHAGGCDSDPDLAGDFNHYTETNVKVAEKFGMTVKVIKETKRCGYTLRKGEASLDTDWSDFDSFWETFRKFYGIAE